MAGYCDEGKRLMKEWVQYVSSQPAENFQKAFMGEREFDKHALTCTTCGKINERIKTRARLATRQNKRAKSQKGKT